MKRTGNIIRLIAVVLLVQLVFPNFSSLLFSSDLSSAKAAKLLAVETPSLPTVTREEQQAWDLLMEDIGNPFGVAGIMGNLWAESGVMPVSYEGYYAGSEAHSVAVAITEGIDNGTISRYDFAHSYDGYGIAGFTYYTLKLELYDFAKANGYSIGNLACQIRYLLKYVKTNRPDLY